MAAGTGIQYSDLCSRSEFSTLNAKALLPESTARAAEVIGGKRFISKGFVHG